MVDSGEELLPVASAIFQVHMYWCIQFCLCPFLGPSIQLLCYIFLLTRCVWICRLLVASEKNKLWVMLLKEGCYTAS